MIDCGYTIIDCPDCGLPVEVEIVAEPEEESEGTLTLNLHPGELHFLCDCDG